MHTGFPAVLCAGVMVVLWALQDTIFNTPACGYCNRRRVHARDCRLSKK
jgi:hypothetical protein